ncbi:MAG TPA: arginine deiminase-related protein [Steroidobacteraceae bacterium]|nr:arginine deiminase-related protein [Steroidobacteraceae bacterium]
MPPVSIANSVADVLMIRPACFGANPQTAASNVFQARGSEEPAAAACAAALECDQLVAALGDAGVRVHLYDDLPDPPRPDAVFPNNWVSFHDDGTVVLYPMLARSRRAERRVDLLADLVSREHFRIERLIDLTHHELTGRFLEGTGSLVLDRIHRIAYACLSPRTDADVAAEFARLLDYDLVTFDALDQDGVPIYHTNVMLALGTHFAVVCADAIPGPQWARLHRRLADSGREIIPISLAQVRSFAGNLIELRTEDDTRVVAMSAAACAAFTPGQRSALEQLAGPIVAAPIPTIERLGGGSVRCMIAEVALPRAS